MFNTHISQSQLKELFDGEVSFITTWRIRYHLSRCCDCADEWNTLQQFHTILYSADLVQSESRPAQRHAGRVPRRTVWKIAGAMAMTCAFAVLLFFAPDWHPAPTSMSAAVGAAVARANTLHLTGWKQINGKRVSWDVWGRRQPFLFYEKIGDEVTVDDGTQRLRIYPPAPALQRPQGLVIRTASQRDSLYLGTPSTENMVRFWDWQHGDKMLDVQASSQTASEVHYLRYDYHRSTYGFNCRQRYTISKQSWLPTQYTLHYSGGNIAQDTEFLAAQYGITVPMSVISPAIPTGYQTVDLSNTASADIHVQSKVVAVDADGNIIVRYKTSLGDNAIVRRTPFFVSARTIFVDAPVTAYRDQTRIRYIPSTTYGIRSLKYTDEICEMYSPLEPMDVVRQLPQQIQAPLVITTYVNVMGSDILALKRSHAQAKNQTVVSEPQQASNILFTITMPQAIVLPQGPTIQSIGRTLPSDMKLVLNMDTPAVQIDQARVKYYQHNMGLSGNTKTQQQHVIYWQKQVIANRSKTDNSRWLRLWDILDLAKLYRDAGDFGQMRQTLRGLILDYQTTPGTTNLEVLQARYAIRTGTFPTDLNYKGP